MELRAAIERIGRLRGTTVLVLAASNLEIDLLPTLYDTLSELGRTRGLDVVLYCRGGVVNAARRIALLLHEFTDRLTFVIPHFCESSGTVLALAAAEIIAGPVAVFSPVDPRLQCAQPSSGDSPLAVSSQDVRLFGKMSEDWFGMEGREAQARALSALCESVFPTTLTSFYRSALEVKDICAQMLEIAHCPEPRRARIIQALLFGYHSHSYALTRQELKDLGLPISTNEEVEGCGWLISAELRNFIGGGARQSVQDDWFDTLVAIHGGARRRRQREGAPAPIWERCEIT